MLFYILVFVILLVILISYLNKHTEIRGVKLLPYLLMLIITPIYAVLQRTILVHIFGTSSLYTEQIIHNNIFHMGVHINELTAVVYGFITIAMLILGMIFSKKIENKNNRITYIISIFFENAILAFLLCKILMLA